MSTPVLRSVNPATEEEIARYELFDEASVERAVAGSLTAAVDLRSAGPEGRAQMLLALACVLRAERDRLAALITAEMGRPLAEAAAELMKSAECCDYYARTAPALLADEPTPSTTSPASRVVFEPLGVAMLIAPWNLPFWQVLRFVVPCLAAGNAVLLKHAPNVSGCALELERIVAAAGFPAGSLTTLLISIPQAERLIADPRVRLVAVTGSTATGARVAALAGAAVKKCLLELGGSDAFIVLADADLEQAAKMGARSRFLNAGQTCLAAKRFLVAEAVADVFERLVCEFAEGLTVGDPTGPVDLGPLARGDLRDKAGLQIAAALAEGATRRTSDPGSISERGFFVRPIVLTGCDPSMTVFREETFGPILPVMRVRDAEHALAVANASDYGLAAAVWTRDAALGESMARRLEVGGVFINGMTHSDPALPFGGTKQSGYGRDLGRFVLGELVNVKTLWRRA